MYTRHQFRQYCKSGYLNGIVACLRMGYSRHEAIELAVECNYVEVLQKLISIYDTIDLSNNDNYCLLCAYESGFKEICDILLKRQEVIKRGIELKQEPVIQYIIDQRDEKINHII